jgi:hypothetical protein
MLLSERIGNVSPMVAAAIPSIGDTNMTEP